MIQRINDQARLRHKLYALLIEATMVANRQAHREDDRKRRATAFAIKCGLISLVIEQLLRERRRLSWQLSRNGNVFLVIAIHGNGSIRTFHVPNVDLLSAKAVSIVFAEIGPPGRFVSR